MLNFSFYVIMLVCNKCMVIVKRLGAWVGDGANVGLYLAISPLAVCIQSRLQVLKKSLMLIMFNLRPCVKSQL